MSRNVDTRTVYFFAHSSLPSDRWPSGAQHHITAIANGLEKKGYDVYLFVVGDFDNPGYLDVTEVVNYYPQNGALGLLLNPVELVSKIFETIRLHGPPDLIYMREDALHWAVPTLSKIMGWPLFLEVNGYLPRAVPLEENFPRTLYYPLLSVAWFNYKTAREILCVSREAKEEIINNFSVSASKVHWVPNAADTSVMERRGSSKCRREIGWDPDQFILGYSGTLAPWYDFEILTQACRFLSRKHENFHPSSVKIVLMCGMRGRETVRQYLDHYEVGDFFEFVKGVPWRDIPTYLNAFDVAITPLAVDNHLGDSMKTYEYMACGVPVLASDIGGLREKVREAKAGLLYDPEDFCDLARRIWFFFNHSSLGEKLGENGHREANRRHDWSDRVNDIDRIVSSSL